MGEMLMRALRDSRKRCIPLKRIMMGYHDLPVVSVGRYLNQLESWRG